MNPHPFGRVAAPLVADVRDVSNRELRKVAHDLRRVCLALQVADDVLALEPREVIRVPAAGSEVERTVYLIVGTQPQSARIHAFGEGGKRFAAGGVKTSVKK